MRSHALKGDRQNSSPKSETVHACYTQTVHALRRNALEPQSYRVRRSGDAHGRTSHPLRHRPLKSHRPSPLPGKPTDAALQGIDAWRPQGYACRMKRPPVQDVLLIAILVIGAIGAALSALAVLAAFSVSLYAAFFG